MSTSTASPTSPSQSQQQQEQPAAPPPHSSSTSPSTTARLQNPTTAPTTGTFTLLLFASASTYASDTGSLSLPAPMTLPQLFDTLEAKFPGMKKKVLRSSAITVNLEYVDFDVDGETGEVLGVRGFDDGGEGGGEGREDGKDGGVVIAAGDEVAVVPPVSSG